MTGMMQMPGGMGPPPPPPLQEGMQTAGFWQPWGQRYQAPPLVFTSPTTLADTSVQELGVQQELPPLEFLENFEEEAGGGKSKGGGKGGGWNRGGKGKLNSGKDSGGGGWGGGKGGGWNSGGGKGR